RAAPPPGAGGQVAGRVVVRRPRGLADRVDELDPGRERPRPVQRLDRAEDDPPVLDAVAVVELPSGDAVVRGLGHAGLRCASLRCSDHASGRRRHPRVPGYSRIAPRDADWTSLAYLASTPRVNVGGKIGR